MAVAITPPPIPGFTKNEIEFSIQSSSYEDKLNYKVRYLIYLEKVSESGTFDVIMQGILAQDDNGLGFIRPATVLHAAILNEVGDSHLPSLSSTASAKAVISRKYKIALVEEYGEVVEQQPEIESAEHVAFLGGVQASEYNNGNVFQNVLLMSDSPNYKEIEIGQHDFISVFSASGTINGSIEVIKRDNHRYSQAISFNAGANGVGRFYVGPSILNDLDNVYQYKITIGAAIKTYAIVDHSTAYHFDLLYLNSFYCPEVFRCKGNQSRKLTVDRFKAVADNVVKQYDYDFDQIIVYRTGYIDKDTANSLQVLFIYNELFEIDPVNNNYVLLDLIDNNYDISESQVFLTALTFEAQISEKKKIIQIK